MPSAEICVVRPSKKVKIPSSAAYEASEKKGGRHVKSLRPAARGEAGPEVRQWLSPSPRQQAHRGHPVSSGPWLPYLSMATTKYPGDPKSTCFS